MRNTFSTQFEKRVSGFTLIEVLIALIIMSVGMLGIAGLYVHSMQAGRTSVFRHNAVTLAGDVADRIRANPRAAASYALADPMVARVCYTAATDCTRDDMALNDIYLWNLQARNTIPNGAVAIVFNNGVNPPTYQITISWTEPGAAPNPSFSITIPVLGI
ncbi:MAG: type IV pilus modification protein PilV [Woeseia sp.]|jgi:type IV pilus assembly protein PilV|nr:type IV pilus modification protein PilV [Woeseia sp.]MBT6211901.1 type IV pilus modification protein PilV [Woeseia sp.]